jgi:beta-lactamase class A
MESYHYVRRRKKKRSRTFLAFLITCFLFFIVFLLLHRSLQQTKGPTELVSPIRIESSTPTPTPGEDDKALGQAVQEALQGTQGNYGIVIKNLSSGKGYTLNEHHRFQTDSLYKLWVMAVVFQDIQSGTLRENQVLSEDVTVLNNKFQIASESAEQTEGTVTISVSDALEKMITVSDNYAALLLTEKIRLSSIATFLREQGLSESSVGTDGEAPYATASDIALFFEKLYEGKLANSTYTEKMLQLLKDQRLNNKLPKYLPDSVVIAHKTGELDDYTHDAGIMYTPDGNYIIVVLSESDDPPSAEERIAEVSKDVYNYLTQEK